MKKLIKIRFQNGLTLESFKRDVFDSNQVSDHYDFIESDKPDFIVFGPYGNDIPPPGNYVRIGYFCENVAPALNICEWAFGIPREEEVNHPKYRRIQWHGLNPKVFIKDISDNEIDKIVSSRSKFCNFVYSKPVPYREEFFRQLNRYKPIDAPGRSMNNTLSLDSLYTGDIWERKRQFLSEYKFTIAFENYCYPGYQTEKLYDAMRANSIPIYCGDPYIGDIFNTDSFLNVPDYLKINSSASVRFLEKISQPDFNDMRPRHFKSTKNRIRRKLKSWGRELKMKAQYNGLNFSNVIDRIIEIDNDPELYKKYLKETWFHDNKIRDTYSAEMRWKEIFG